MLFQYFISPTMDLYSTCGRFTLIGIGVSSCMYAVYKIFQRYCPKQNKPDTFDEILQRIVTKRSKLMKQNDSQTDEILSKLLENYAWHSLRLEDEEIDDKALNGVLAASSYAEKYLKIGHIEEVHIRGIHGNSMNDSYLSGQFRNHDVMVGGLNNEVYCPPSSDEVPERMTEFICWLNLQKNSPRNIISTAAMAYLKFIAIHPFLKGNGRTGRAIFNGLIRQCGYPWAVMKSTDKVEYYESMHVYLRNGDATPFCSYVARNVENALDELIK